MNRIAPTLIVPLLAGPIGLAQAQPVIDGTLDAAFYGDAVAVQTVQTGFGDNFSELNAAYANVANDTLYLMLTGNLENNFNKLAIFFDSVDGGQNSIDAVNNPQNFDDLNGSGFENGWDSLTNRGLADTIPFSGTGTAPGEFSEQQAGAFTFDTGFEADYALLFRRGAGGADLDFAIMNQTAVAANENFGIFGSGDEGSNTVTDFTLDVVVGDPTDNFVAEVAYDGSNTAGVGGTTGEAADPAAALAVTTGFEIGIPLEALGLTEATGSIRVTAGVSSSNFDFWSNQFLGGVPVGTGNLGSNGQGNFLQADADLDGDLDDDDDFDGNPGPDPLGSGLVDLNDVAGDQFFTINLGDTAGIVGDYDEDGQVAQGDLNLVLNNWGQARTFEDPGGTVFSTANVDQEELNGVLNNWGAQAAPSFAGSAVPEPATFAVLGGLALAGLRRRRVA